LSTPGTPDSAQSGGRVGRLFAAITVSGVALLSVASSAPAATFDANPATLGAIPDGVGTPPPCKPGASRDVQFDVSGLQAPITDVQVSLTLNPQAQFAGDLVVSLVSPGGGATQSIFGRTGLGSGPTPTFGDSSDLAGPYTFADSAPANPKWWDAATAEMTGAAPIASGSYRASTLGSDPAGGSSTLITPTFAGLSSPNGTWTLQFIDCAIGGANPGTVSAATLGITSPAIPPSNQFSFGKLKLNKNKGTAILTVDVPGAGTLTLGGKGIVPQRLGRSTGLVSKAVAGAGKVKLKIKAKGAKKTKLNENGKVKVKAKVTFAPTGGSALTHARKIRLKKNL